MNHEKHERHEKILLAEECYRIQGAIYGVYRELGSGFLESVYQECLEREFVFNGIPFESQKDISLLYRGQRLKQSFRTDFLCFDSVILEIKAVREIAPEHKAQVLNYLKATGRQVGLLVNFGSHPKVTIQRFVLLKHHARLPFVTFVPFVVYFAGGLARYFEGSFWNFAMQESQQKETFFP